MRKFCVKKLLEQKRPGQGKPLKTQQPTSPPVLPFSLAEPLTEAVFYGTDETLISSINWSLNAAAQTKTSRALACMIRLSSLK